MGETRTSSGSEDSSKSAGRSSFARKAWISAGIVGLLLLITGLVQAATQVLLIIFAGMLLGVFIDGLTRFVERHTPLGRRISWGIVVLLLAGAVFGFGFYFGPKLAEQIDGLGTRLQETITQIENWAAQYGWTSRLLERGSTEEMAQSLLDWAGGWGKLVTGALGAVGSVLTIVVAGIYFSLAPGRYLDAVMRLCPIDYRPRMRQVVSACGIGLRSWLAGRFFSMALVWVGTSLGLWLIDVPLALALGFIAGILSFVPNIGPILAALPGAAIALTVSTTTMLLALVVYTSVQVVETYFITPFVEQHVVSLPPGFLLSVQLLFGLLAGLLGLFMATPLAVVGVVTIQLLYIEDILGDAVAPLGEEHPVQHAPQGRRRHPSSGSRPAQAST